MGTLIKTRYPVIYFDNFDISNQEQLKYKKEDIKSYIEDIKSDLMSLSMSTPKDIYKDKEYETPFDYVKEKFKELYDSLSEEMYDLHQLDFMEDLINEWEYSCYDKEKELYENNTSNAFREDKKEKINFVSKNSFNLSPDDKDIINIFNRAKRNIEFNRKNIDFLKDKYIILFDDEIFVTENDQFIFTNEENARKVLYDKFDLRIYDYINRDFISSNREFFISFHNVLSETEYLKLMEDIDKLTESKVSKESMDIISEIYDLLKDGIYTMFERHIKVVKINDLIKNLESKNINLDGC